MDINEEYKRAYRFICFIAIDTWKNHNQVKELAIAWDNWVSNNATLSNNPALDNAHIMIEECPFLCGVFGYEPELAEKLVRRFYVEEYNIKNKTKHGTERTIIDDIFGI